MSKEVDVAVDNIGLIRKYQLNGNDYIVAFLIREEDWRPISASWWRGKSASVIGADLSGNFFIAHCDGTVRYWDHSKQKDIVLSKSVREFLTSLKFDEESVG